MSKGMCPKCGSKDNRKDREKFSGADTGDRICNKCGYEDVARVFYETENRNDWFFDDFFKHIAKKLNIDIDISNIDIMSNKQLADAIQDKRQVIIEMYKEFVEAYKEYSDYYFETSKAGTRTDRFSPEEYKKYSDLSLNMDELRAKILNKIQEEREE